MSAAVAGWYVAKLRAGGWLVLCPEHRPGPNVSVTGVEYVVDETWKEDD